ncbi:MAG: selenide, water dikinase SelD [Salinivirgaceae bacterium]|nr:selenide, water dikinase SelD [Salinivirgaceae bacterium]
MSTSIEQKYTPATADNIKLTHYTHGLGCACKIEPQKLDNVLKKLAPVTNANVLVGTDTSDDAAVYLINKEQALVQTLDFFTPIVDNAFDFGSIAAANALSDVYAMGAKPLFALNIVGFPDDTLPMEVLEQMLLGAQAKAQEAGIPILGGHTIEDPEPKYGMVVSGLVHPEKIWKNQGAQPGDALVLTKPLGTGIISTGMKRGLIDEQAIKALTQQMSELNKYAAEALEGFNVHACTDVTGFGLLGHLYEMLNPTNSAARLYFDHVPFIDTAVTLAAGGVIPGGTHRNLNYVQSHIQFGKRSKTQQLLLADAQTSGGLLIAMDKNEAEQYCKNFVSPGVSQGVIIGEIIEKNNETVIEIA